MDEHSPTNRADDVRYAPRAVEDGAWMGDLLHDEPAGVVGLVDDGAPYVVPQLFAYDEDRAAIFFHGANDGRTRRIVERGADPAGAEDPAAAADAAGEDDRGVPACLAVHRMGRFVAAEHPVDFDVEYESVVVFGRVRLVRGEHDKREALERFMAAFAPHMTPGEDYEPIQSASVERTSVYRLDVAGWSGKRNATGEDDPMAYSLDE